MKKRVLVIDPPCICGTYDDKDVADLLELYVLVFGVPAPGAGDAPSRMIPMYEAIRFEKAMTLEDIENNAVEDARFTFDSTTRRWELARA